MTHIDKNKRALLFGRRRIEPAPLRPPWAKSELAFLDACTACGDCIRACPEQILEAGAGRYPVTNFLLGACTFCQRCVDVCQHSAFGDIDQPAWQGTVQVADTCFAKNRIVCQSCGDGCETQAIRFRPQLGGASVPAIQSDLCTLCGACFSACPAAAITFEPSTFEHRESAR